MTDTRLDRVSRRLGRRANRRRALAVTATGLVAPILTPERHRDRLAQETSSTLTLDDTGNQRNPPFLFVQAFAAGTLTPRPDEVDAYDLALAGHTAQTIYFSDRPTRIAGVVPTGQFLDGLGFTPENPPNAALVANSASGEDILIIELFDPNYDDTVGTLSFVVKILAGYQEAGLASLATRRTDATVPPAFGAANLFIDGCSPNDVECVAAGGDGDVVHTYAGLPECFVSFSGTSAACAPCEGSVNGDGRGLLRYWNNKCNTEISACASDCFARVYVGG